MVLSGCLRAALLGLLSLAFLPSAANAAPSFADAIKEVDAKYLEVPDVEGEDNAPKIEASGGEEEETPGPQEISQGAVKAAFSYSEDKGEDGEITRTPVVTIFADGKEVAKLEEEGTGFADPPVSVQIAEINPGNQYPEVVVSFYTGAPIAAPIRAWSRAGQMDRHGTPSMSASRRRTVARHRSRRRWAL
jgi:hypothetical protein